MMYHPTVSSIADRLYCPPITIAADAVPATPHSLVLPVFKSATSVQLVPSHVSVLATLKG